MVRVTEGALSYVEFSEMKGYQQFLFHMNSLMLPKEVGVILREMARGNRTYEKSLRYYKQGCWSPLDV